jgi:hypothetical protein
MDIEILGLLGLALTTTGLATIYQRRMDVLYGPIYRTAPEAPAS